MPDASTATLQPGEVCDTEEVGDRGSTIVDPESGLDIACTTAEAGNTMVVEALVPSGDCAWLTDVRGVRGVLERDLVEDGGMFLDLGDCPGPMASRRCAIVCVNCNVGVTDRCWRAPQWEVVALCTGVGSA